MTQDEAHDGSARAIEPARFPLSDKRVYDAYIASRQSAVMAVAVRAGLFDRLSKAGEGLGFEELRSGLPWSERGMRSVLSALVAMDLVSATGPVGLEDVLYRSTPEANAYLTRGTPGSLWGLIDMEVDHYLSPAALTSALEKDDSSVYQGQDPWEAHELDPERAEAFTAAMHSVSERPAAGFAERVDLSGVRRLLDVGGGSGALCIALCRVHSELHCTIQDIPVVCKIALEYVEKAGCTGQVDTHASDMWTEPFPNGYDAVLLSQILHDWSYEKGEVLLRKAMEALPHKGRLFIHEKLVEDEREAPLANALVHLDMLVWTEGQQYRAVKLREVLERLGFVDVRVTRTTGYWSVVEATKP